jgi:hypothetical protein
MKTAATFRPLREQTGKSSEMVTFFVKKHSLLHPFIDFRGSSPEEGFGGFKTFF